MGDKKTVYNNENGIVIIDYWQSVNEIGDKGIEMITEALKTNTNLTSINLSSWAEYQRQQMKKIKILHGIGTKIGNEGAKMIGEMLKINTSLLSLNMKSNMLHKNEVRSLIMHCLHYRQLWD